MVPGVSLAIPVPNSRARARSGSDPVEPHLRVQGAGFAAPIGDRRREVVLQIASDATQRDTHRDTVLAKRVGIADARQHEQLR